MDIVFVFDFFNAEKLRSENSLRKDTLKAFGGFKNKQKSVPSNFVWYVKVHMFWKSIQCPKHCDKTQMLEKFTSNKANVTKNALCYLLRAPTHHSFTFSSQFLHEPKHQLSFFFSILLRFYLVLVFWSKKAWTVWLQHHNCFKLPGHSTV